MRSEWFANPQSVGDRPGHVARLRAHPASNGLRAAIHKERNRRTPMRVSILGAGAIAYGLAVYLAEAGHDPMLWSPSGKRTEALAAGELLKATGAIETTVPVRIAKDCKEAIATADVVMIALPANGHKKVMDAAAPYLG